LLPQNRVSSLGSLLRKIFSLIPFRILWTDLNVLLLLFQYPGYYHSDLLFQDYSWFIDFLFFVYEINSVRSAQPGKSAFSQTDGRSPYPQTRRRHPACKQSDTFSLPGHCSLLTHILPHSPINRNTKKRSCHRNASSPVTASHQIFQS